MSDGLITSANATAFLTVETLFSAPVKLENWASDKGWEGERWKIAEGKMSIDGKLNRGYIAQPVNLNLTFSANSSSLEIFDVITAASAQARTSYQLGLIFSMPSLGRRFSYINGFISEFDPLPPGHQLLENRSVHMVFERMIPAGIPA